MKNNRSFRNVKAREPIEEFSDISVYKISSVQSYVYPHKVNRQRIRLNDQILSIGFLLEESLSGFEIEG